MIVTLMIVVRGNEIIIVWFWLFFFFKQKTAYEMRISDWSSDVCSSDLFPGVSNAWTMPIRARIDMLSTGIRTPVGVKVFGSDLAQKIGRASCRERVCQYV